MGTFSLLHLSDLHIGVSRPLARHAFPCHDSNALIALAEFIWNKRHKIDAILISGDIVSIGGEQDYLMIAERFFKQPASTPYSEKQPWITEENTPTISFFKKPVILMPGNHDRYHGKLGRPGCTLFDEHFADYWPVAHGGVWRYILRKNDSSLGVVIGDFSLISRGDNTVIGGHFGQGIIDHRINAMKAETERIREDGAQAVIWMIHFVPEIDRVPEFKNINRLKRQRMNLINCDQLSAAAEAVGVNHLFCGHTHIQSLYIAHANKNLSVYCAGTSTCVAAKEDTMIHLREINIDNGVILPIKSQNLKYISHPDKELPTFRLV